MIDNYTLNKLKINGRHQILSDGLHFYNVGSGVSLKVKSHTISFDLICKNKDGYFYIIFDKNYDTKKRMFLKQNSLQHISIDCNDNSYVDIVKANESNDNELIVQNISCDGEILQYDIHEKISLKIYGDSSVAGFGILAHDGEATIHNSDGVENYCFRSAFELGYDIDILAASGYGLTFSAYTNPEDAGIEKFQENLCVNSDIKWVKNRNADLLVISLGTNDQAYIEKYKEKEEILTHHFINSYAALIKKEIRLNPNLKIVMLYGSLKEEKVYSLIEKTYKTLCSEIGNLYLLKINGDNSAISNHSYYTFHKSMSDQLIEFLSKVVSANN